MSATDTKPSLQIQSETPSAAPRTAKLFMNGRSQAVRLPKEFRFDGVEVVIRRDPATGEVILTPAPTPAEPSLNFDGWFALYDAIPDNAGEEEFAKLPPRPKNLTTEQLFKIFGRAKYPDEFFERRRVIPQPAWEERFAVWDSLGSSNEDALERDLTPPVERDFF